MPTIAWILSYIRAMEEEFSYGYENITIEATTNTPKIILNKDEGLIEIRGKSIPENTQTFYYHFNRWLTEYSFSPAPQTQVILAIDYMNSSSSLVVTQLIKLLNDMIGLKSQVQVKWFYETDDIDMKEQGEYYQEVMKIPIEVIQVDNMTDPNSD
ncbi:DUF1987 domain-containing protein [Crocinitomix catalasitica]|nr:DUF1987 domain-containing protein [Crocinitomix catalasitica]